LPSAHRRQRQVCGGHGVHPGLHVHGLEIPDLRGPPVPLADERQELLEILTIVLPAPPSVSGRS
jgi:hypothetical protein